MTETRSITIEQIKQFLDASSSIEFSAAGDDNQRYANIRRVRKRFDYLGRKKREPGALRK